MKKKYLRPLTEVAEMRTETMICGSRGVTSNKGIGYGGVDEGGVLDPASRQSRDDWDDE